MASFPMNFEKADIFKVLKNKHFLDELVGEIDLDRFSLSKGERPTERSLEKRKKEEANGTRN